MPWLTGPNILAGHEVHVGVDSVVVDTVQLHTLYRCSNLNAVNGSIVFISLYMTPFRGALEFEYLVPAREVRCPGDRIHRRARRAEPPCASS